MKEVHTYTTKISWTGNKGTGTSDYRAYERAHKLTINGKPTIECSSDPTFLGDPTKHNPEELLLASLSSCHMLWYLHFCSVNGVIVISYADDAMGSMQTEPNGSGAFTQVTLQPKVIVKDKSMIEKAMQLHKKANAYCFIANSVNFKVCHNANCKTL